MIIQNQSLGVPGRAAQSMGPTGGAAQRFQSKIKPCVTAAELFTEPSKLALSLARQPRQLSGGADRVRCTNSSLREQELQCRPRSWLVSYKPLATITRCTNADYADASAATAPGRRRIAGRTRGPSCPLARARTVLRGELVDILFRRGAATSHGKTIWRPSPMYGSSGRRGRSASGSAASPCQS